MIKEQYMQFNDTMQYVRKREVQIVFQGHISIHYSPYLIKKPNLLSYVCLQHLNKTTVKSVPICLNKWFHFLKELNLKNEILSQENVFIWRQRYELCTTLISKKYDIKRGMCLHLGKLPQIQLRIKKNVPTICRDGLNLSNCSRNFEINILNNLP